MTRLLNVAVPTRLGRDFRWLLSSSLINNTGDGIVLAAGPLLVASQTRDPFMVSLAVMFEYLPALLFAVPAGGIADRFDRRRIVVLSNVARALVLAFVVATIVTGNVNIALVLAAIFLLGTAETFADTTASTLLPIIVEKQDLGIANARMQGGFILLNQLVVPPIGAFLFAAGMAIPFGVNAVAFLFGAVLISRISADVGRVTRHASGATPKGFGTDLVDGLRWIAHNVPMRTLALTIFAFNVTYGAAWGVLVLYAGDRLGMDAVGFGLLTTAAAAGGIVGTLSYGALERRFSLGNMMRVGLVIETATHLALALTSSATVALVIMFVFGVHAFIWGTTATVVRQRSVPNELMGRVGGVYRVAVFGGMVVGVPLGGLLAGAFGITAPFWFGFVGSAVLVVLLWRQFGYIAHH
ncbi:MAG TPA: MFS transporter [Candidatus Limnocylindrales bacterium]|nr:MFS transporter [Candidatus Limnocylindrales bacterium]